MNRPILFLVAAFALSLAGLLFQNLKNDTTDLAFDAERNSQRSTGQVTNYADGSGDDSYAGDFGQQKGDLGDPYESLGGLQRIVEFADGERVEIEFRSASTDQSVGINSLGFGALHELALTDNSEGAYAAFKIAEACSDLPRTQEELESDVARLQQSFQLPDSDSDSDSDFGHLGPNANLSEIEAQMRLKFDSCREYFALEDLAKEPEAYLKQAADGGVFPATLQYARLIESNNLAMAIEYFEKAWDSGDVNAALALGEVYLKGGSGIEPNRDLAYAYTYVGAALSNAFFEGQAGPTSDSIRKIVAEKNAARLAPFFPSEIESGTAVAKSLLKKNKKCCVY